jgi:hypothetical protein
MKPLEVHSDLRLPRAAQPSVAATLLQSIAIGVGCTLVTAVVFFAGEYIHWRYFEGLDYVNWRWLFRRMAFHPEIGVAVFAVSSSSFAVARWIPIPYPVAFASAAVVSAIAWSLCADYVRATSGSKNFPWKELLMEILLIAPSWMLAVLTALWRFGIRRDR